ncbi:DUF4270 domain-containing protein [Pedobacter arcticus]|uniref:DUF4270 domain-containing protein n=1 Tax=Pedobacter arcticus TaxID=752140 RepID=UPI0002D4DEBA|nr:DUF4270 domain-containing protein [Pedobacter arcticus]
MRFIKSDLLTLLVSLFILGSCKNPTGVGLDVGPDIALETKLVDTSTVITKLQKQDSVIANFTERSVLGYFNDAVFGKTTANLALGLTMPSSNYKFGTSTVLDSAILVLPYTEFYGDSTNSTFTAEVRQLDEVLYNESGKSYYSNKKWLTKSTVIGTKIMTTNLKDSITLQDIRKGQTDSTKRVPRQLRIKLDANFVKNNIIDLDSVNKISNLTFNNYIKGLFISMNKGATTGAGGLFSFNTNTSGATRLDIFYKSTVAGVTDTLVNTFTVNGVNGDAATELTWDMDGTVVKTALASTDKNSNLLYLKGLGGTFVKVEFPHLDSLKKLGKNVAINRAELVLYTENTPANNLYKPISKLRTYRWDIANRPQLIPDESPNDPRYLGPGFIGGFYSSNSKSYTFNFTGYVQDLISGKIKNYGTFITPSDFTASSIFNNLGRLIVGGGVNTAYKVKLRVFYTDQK